MSQKLNKLKRKVYKKTIKAFCETEIAATLERKLKKQKKIIFILSSIIGLLIFLIGGLLIWLLS